MTNISYESYKYSSSPSSSHGDRWATEEELKSDLFRIRLSDEGDAPRGGFPVISSGDEVYVDDSDTHNLIIGSTGSKKTRLFVMPMLEILRKAGESVFVTDPKGELYDLTAQAFEDAGYRIYVVNLRDPDQSDCWNPLFLARAFYKAGNPDQATVVINDFAESIISAPARNLDPFWTNTSKAMLRGMAMMMVENEEHFPDDMVHIVNLRLLSRELNDNGEPGLTYDIVKTYPEDSVARSNLESVVRGSEKTFDNICVSYDADMQGLYIQNSLMEMLSGNTVDFTKLGTERTIFYLIMPDEKTTLHKIVSLMIKQCYIQLINSAQHMEGNRLPVRVNFLLDEFSNLPRIPDMSAMISAARSRNIRFHLIIQGLYQLSDKYGEEAAHTIKGNCSNWAFLTSRELPLLREIRDLCGTYEDGRPLITTTQLQRLNKEKGEALLLIGRHYPFITHLPDISEYTGYKNRPCIRPFPQRDKTGLRFYTESELRKTFRDINEMDALQSIFDSRLVD